MRNNYHPTASDSQTLPHIPSTSQAGSAQLRQKPAQQQYDTTMAQYTGSNVIDHDMPDAPYALQFHEASVYQPHSPRIPEYGAKDQYVVNPNTSVSTSFSGTIDQGLHDLPLSPPIMPVGGRGQYAAYANRDTSTSTSSLDVIDPRLRDLPYSTSIMQYDVQDQYIVNRNGSASPSTFAATDRNLRNLATSIGRYDLPSPYEHYSPHPPYASPYAASSQYPLGPLLSPRNHFGYDASQYYGPEADSTASGTVYTPKKLRSIFPWATTKTSKKNPLGKDIICQSRG